jgi:glycosyltransferase involved in cell wall biosynthesis
MKRLLIIAYSFPPRTSSGARRMIGFVRYLPEYGWEPIVVVPQTCYYNDCHDDDLYEIPEGLRVIRTAAYLPRYGYAGMKNVARNRLLRFIGRFLVPDRAIGWLPQAFDAARQLMKENGCQALLTSGPRFSVQVIGLAIKRSTGIPWVADFRDPWTDNPAFKMRHPLKRALNKRLEAAVVRSADKLTVSSPAVADSFVARYKLPEEKLECISNGFDRRLIDNINATRRTNGNDHIVITYCGNLGGSSGEAYGRLPDAFLRGVARAIKYEPALIAKLKLRFVGTFPESSHKLVTELGLEKMVQIIGRVSHRQSLEYQKDSDGLLLITGCTQAAAHWVISAKLYEYLGIGHPILALCLSDSWEWRIILQTGAGLVCGADENELTRTIIAFCNRIYNGGGGFVRDEAAVAAYDYQHLTRRFVALLGRMNNAGT